jgi:hypothetical protein
MDILAQKLIDVLIDTINSEGIILGDEEAIKNILEEAMKAGYTIKDGFLRTSEGQEVLNE